MWREKDRDRPGAWQRCNSGSEEAFVHDDIIIEG